MKRMVTFFAALLALSIAVAPAMAQTKIIEEAKALAEAE